MQRILHLLQLTRRRYEFPCSPSSIILGFTFVAICTAAGMVGADVLPEVTKAEVQPLLLHAERLAEALDYLGQPLPVESKRMLDKAKSLGDDAAVRKLVQHALEPLCLFGVQINPESRVKVSVGPATATLTENEWSPFLVKVHNTAGVTAPLRATSPQAGKLHDAPQEKLRDLWLDLNMYDDRPLSPSLSGIQLEYRVIQLYSRDVGKRAAVISFDVGQGSQDLGFRNDVTVTFDCLQSIPVTLQIRDENGRPTTAGLVIKDKYGRTYPSSAKRLAPDFSFHPQIYRHDGEKIHLPRGTYNVTVTRGPEYHKIDRELVVGDEPTSIQLHLKRWIDPATFGWWSGDHHIHAAGCSHYSKPSEGVHAADMFRHCLGEDLKVGANLTWGPCFDYQKQFFTGQIDKVSRYPYLLRYDVEVSGFGSHESGHLCLLRLTQQTPPGGDSTDHWPKLGLNTLRWAKKQGAVCGPAHSGWGLEVPGTELPNYNMPPYDSIGANEYVVDVTHTVTGPDGDKVPAIDFLSMVDTPYVWELNMWYHTLNCGFQTRISGETDFPCIYGERVGLGRSYVKLAGKLDYNSWCEGIRRGSAYVSDGRSHLIDFKVNRVTLDAGVELRLPEPGPVKVTAKVAALLPKKPNDDIKNRPYTEKPYWHLERARLGETDSEAPSRKIKLELLANGLPIAEKTIEADGELRDVQFEATVDRSSWLALRILPSSHTNPVFVIIDQQPIRASRRSAEWCLKGVEQCRQQKERFMDEDELDDFNKAYDHAVAVYQKILDESNVE